MAVKVYSYDYILNIWHSTRRLGAVKNILLPVQVVSGTLLFSEINNRKVL